MSEDKIRASIAMATYNGEKYIKEQIDTILKNMNDNDEIIISDDGSKDDTINIIKEYIKKDNRIKLINGPKQGVKQNFANAIKNANGEYIFLCDQDDLWENNKIEKLITLLKENVLVVHDAKIINQNENVIEESFFKFRNSGKGIIKNIYKNAYIGCCMAFRSELIKYILPIPNNIEMHDQWIGVIAELHGKVTFINDKLILYRRHEKNVSSFKHYPVSKMLNNRINFIIQLIKISRSSKWKK